MLKTDVLLHIFVETVICLICFSFFQWIEISKEQHLFKLAIVFKVNFDRFNASLLNKSIYLFTKILLFPNFFVNLRWIILFFSPKRHHKGSPCNLCTIFQVFWSHSITFCEEDILICFHCMEKRIIFFFQKLCDIMTSISFLGVYAFKNNRSQWEVSI